MVSAELLAQLELQCRELMQDVNLARYSSDGRARPFGGLNVILPNDLYQLPLPKGTFLGDIPWELVAGRKATKQATALHGQTLLWGGPDAGMQGVTELVLCERTSDCKGRSEVLRAAYCPTSLSEASRNLPEGAWQIAKVLLKATCMVPKGCKGRRRGG